MLQVNQAEEVSRIRESAAPRPLWLRQAFRYGLVSSLAMALLGVGAHPAFAQGGADKAARDEVDHAMAEYLQMNFGQAEADLLATIQRCESKCRPATIARAWMYVGVVRGSGKGDQHAAMQAFQAALAEDRKVKLDTALATPETKNTFKAAKDNPSTPEAVPPLIGAAVGGGADVPGSASETAVPAPPSKAASASITCTPGLHEIQTRRPIPFERNTDAEVVRMSLRYRKPGERDWHTLEMRQKGKAFRAQVPCEATADAGGIDFFIVATDSQGDPLDTLGSKGQPLRFAVDGDSNAAPAYPGEDPPPRCEERVLCPPDFPGCVDETDSGESTRDSAAKAAPRNWFGIHFAADVGFIGGENVCANDNPDFDCFNADGGAPYPPELPPAVAAEVGERGDVYPGTGIDTGAATGTLRVLLSYDHAVSERMSLGARLGYAFGGGPDTVDGRSFLPIHAEGRLSYWLRGVDATGVRPYLHLGGGIAQVDLVKRDITVRDCSEELERSAFLDCIQAQNAYDSASPQAQALPTKTLDAYRKLGNGFVTLGGGVLVPLGGAVGLQLNLNAMLMLPSVGFVLQPSLGLVYAL